MKLNKTWLLSVRACGQDRTKSFDHEPTEQDVENFYNQINRSCRVSQIECKVVYLPEHNINHSAAYQGSIKLCDIDRPKMNPTIRKF